MAHAEHSTAATPAPVPPFRVVTVRPFEHEGRTVSEGEEFPEALGWPHFAQLVRTGTFRLEGESLPVWYRPRVGTAWQRAEEIPTASTREEAVQLHKLAAERFEAKVAAGVPYGPGEANWFRAVLGNVHALAPDLLQPRLEYELEDMEAEWASRLASLPAVVESPSGATPVVESESAIQTPQAPDLAASSEGASASATPALPPPAPAERALPPATLTAARPSRGRRR
jgi:hypothetical protein